MNAPLTQKHIDWLLKAGVPPLALARPLPLLWDGNGALYVQEDDAYWNVKTGQVIGGWCLGDTYLSRDWMSGEWTVPLHETPLDWLKASREGIVVLDWSQLFDRLRDVPVVSMPDSLRAKYGKWMRPARLPRLHIRPQNATGASRSPVPPDATKPASGHA